MEVHHHNHSTGKKWTHYFWEFMMLFLAVFCGFLAENKREHIVEKHRAKDYARALIADLKKDTTEIRKVIEDNNDIRGYIDSVQAIATRYHGKDKVPAIFYYYSRLATTSSSTTWQNSTLRQLINSGNARYFRSDQLLQKLSEYDMKASHINSQQENDRLFRNVAMELRSRILDASYFGPIAGVRKENDNSGILDSMGIKFYPLYNNDPALMNEFLNSMHNRKATISYLMDHNLPLNMQTAIELIGLLEKEYNLN